LLHADGVATPLFDSLMTAVFVKLDPSNTGYLGPEAVSHLMDLQRFRLEHNVCKRTRDFATPESPRWRAGRP
jgi:hypothetical protein